MYYSSQLALRNIKLSIVIRKFDGERETTYLSTSGIVAGSGDFFSFSFAMMAAVSGHRAAVNCSPEIRGETFLTAFDGLLQELIVAAVLLAATPWLLSFGYKLAALW